MTTLRNPGWNLADLASVEIRVVAFNSIGDSITSDEGNGATIPIADTIPQPPSSFTTDSQSTSSITISWTEPADNGGDPITDYEIDWDQGATTNSYTPLVSTTSGTRTHTISGLTIAGEVYKFKVRAVNSVGTSVDSAEYQVIGASLPNKPTTLVRDDTSTTKTQVSFSWSAPVDNGGSSIIDYEVEMDDNNDNVYSVVATGIGSTAHIETGLSAGNAYRFKVRARNAIGYSVYSDVFTITAATVPSKPATPSTTLNVDSTQVILDWSLPTDTGGLTVDGYKVEIKTSTGTWV